MDRWKYGWMERWMYWLLLELLTLAGPQLPQLSGWSLCISTPPYIYIYHATLFLIPVCTLSPPHRSNRPRLVTNHMLCRFPSHFISFSDHAVRLSGLTRSQKGCPGRKGVDGGEDVAEISELITEAEPASVRMRVNLYFSPPVMLLFLSLSLYPHCRGNTGGLCTPKFTQDSR